MTRDNSNNRMVRLDQGTGNSLDRQAECLRQCEARGASGCELVWDNGCFMHSEAVMRGDGSEDSYCWKLTPQMGSETEV